MGLQASLILSVSHLIQLVSKPIGQPATIAQLFAGLLLGPSCLSQIKAINVYFFQTSSADYYEVMAFFGRISFLFLIGLELDVCFLKRQLHAACTIAYGGALPCLVFAGAVSYPFFGYYARHPGSPDHLSAFVLLLMILVADSASPLAVRMAAELNLVTCDFGRLAVGSALINDMSCLLFAVIVGNILDDQPYSIWLWILSLTVTGVVSLSLRNLANWLNNNMINTSSTRNNYKYLRNAPLACVVLIIVLTAGICEIMGENSILASFLLGVMFPRQGKTARTLSVKLSYAVYTFLLPIYFGYIGFQVDLSVVSWGLKDVIGILTILLLCAGGKIVGTLAACHRLKIPIKKAIVLALLLNLKGHFVLLTLRKTKTRMLHDWDDEFFNLMLVTLVMNSLISGMVVAFVVSRDSMTFGYRPVALEWQSPDHQSELRVLACVHGPRHVPSLVRLIGGLSWSKEVPVAAYLMHVIEFLPKKRRTADYYYNNNNNSNKTLLYHQLEDDELSDDDGGTAGNLQDVLEINEAVDSFVAETGIFVHLINAVSPPASIFEDVCKGAEDVRALIMILPFHKHQRIDGKMESGKEGLRTTNQRVLRHAPCTVAILVDRGLPMARPPSSSSSSYSSQAAALLGMQHVAVLFFGGPDDREALSFSKHIGMHHHASLAVIRFVLARELYSSSSSSSSRHGVDHPVMSTHVRINISYEDHEDPQYRHDPHESKEEEEQQQVLMAMPSRGADHDDEADNAFLEDFYNRYVRTGKVGYVEKHVSNGAQTVAALRDIGDMYQLFIVGKGTGQRDSPLTTGLTDWEECPELGTVGDLLASSEFDTDTSVLVIQQRRPLTD
ncbi:hypothetical protein Dimus_014382 [Dionaea muscipula]